MFAKLKKKIQEESSVDLTDKSFMPHGPGLASPVTSPVTSPTQTDPPATESDMMKLAPGLANRIGSDVSRQGLSDGENGQPNGSHSDYSDMKDPAATKEDVLAMLIKRTEQVRKLEHKVSELAAKIKERNRNIEKLEKELEKQQDATSRKISEMNEQYSANKIKMSEGLTTALREQEESMKQELRRVKDEKEKLEAQLQDAEVYKTKYFKKEEESDELAGLANQEMAKIKHMLLIKEEELTSMHKEIYEKTQRLETAETRQSELRQEVDNLLQQITQLTSTNDQIEARNEALHAKVQELTKENKKLQEAVTESDKHANKSSKKLGTLQHVYAELYNDHQVLQRTSDMHRRKCKAVMEQKDLSLAHASERIITLEKRLKNSTTTGDELVRSLEAERDKLEKQLDAERKHLSEIKITYSNHCNHLEAEVARLNKKIVEEREERERSGRDSERMVENLKLQREELLQRVQIAEKRERDTLEIAVDKDRQLLQKTEELQKKIVEETLKSALSEDKLSKEVASLRAQLSELEQQRAKEASTAQQKIADLERAQSETLEREIDAENQISSVEAELRCTKDKLNSREKEAAESNAKLKDTMRELEALLKNAKKSEGVFEKQQKRVEDLQAVIDCLKTDYQTCNKEKNTLMLRNAQLSQDLETERHKTRQRSEEHLSEIRKKECAIQGLEQSLQDHQKEISEHLKKVQDLEAENLSSLKKLESAEVLSLKEEVKELEAQVLDKTKTIKIQQQRLTDLKKTLQRELKVQSMPNDDQPLSDSESVRAPSRSLAEARSNSAASLHHSASSLHPPQNFPRVTPSSLMNSTEATLMGSMGMPLKANNNHHQPFNSHGEYDLSLDVNLEYLKHVVLKFVLSRETESVHLIKALSMLLKLSTDEQKLIKETLEYKSSWFGRMPPMGKGQTAKVIPPSY